jgi:ferredoxin
MHFDQLCGRAAEVGLAVRGAFHPESGEFDRSFSLGSVGTIVLLGFTGGLQWEHFARAAEAGDGLPHPLDRWSRRVIGALAREFDAVDVYPSGDTAALLPFQQLALRCEPVHRSPIGLLIHAQWGLWHAYRGALVLPHTIELPALGPSAHPCTSCAAKPCLGACPVGAFRPGAFDLDACVDHVLSDAGRECRERGCLARRACPLGTQFRYGKHQARCHMQAFVRSAR